MMDTITLSVPITNMDNINLKQFKPSAEGIFTTDMSYRRYVRNPSKSEKDSNIYLPIYTLYRRFGNAIETNLLIQFSVPKLIFNNNFQEVSESDFNKVIQELIYKLESNQIYIPKERLVNALVVAYHPSKNILLKDGINCSMVINQLYKALDANLQQDFTQVIFKNGGQILHIHSMDYEFAIYDKVRELQQASVSEKRSIEKQGYTQFSLLDDLVANNFLRLEFRMNSVKAIKAKIKSYAPEFEGASLTFKSLFNEKLCKAMLTGYWNKEIKAKYINIIWKPEDFFEKSMSIKSLNPKLSHKDLMLVSFMQGIISTRGIQSLRSYMRWLGKNSYQWYKHKKLMKNLKIEDNRLYLIEDINKQLLEFKPFKTIPNEIKGLDIFSKMINTDKYDED